MSRTTSYEVRTSMQKTANGIIYKSITFLPYHSSLELKSWDDLNEVISDLKAAATIMFGPDDSNIVG